MTDRVIITKNKIDILADSISIKSGVSTPMTLAEMKHAVDSISVGQGIVPTGTLTIVENGIYNVETYATANVNIPSSGGDISLQTKTVIPSESTQIIRADAGYDGLSSVSVGAISSTYVGSEVTRKATATITPGTTNQIIASNTYLTGAQTISGDANLISSNIAEGVSIFGVLGTHRGGSASSGVVYIVDEEDQSGKIIRHLNTDNATVTTSIDSHGGTVYNIIGEEVRLQTKRVTPTNVQQEITADYGYGGLYKVIIEPQSE